MERILDFYSTIECLSFLSFSLNHQFRIKSPFLLENLKERVGRNPDYSKKAIKRKFNHFFSYFVTCVSPRVIKQNKLRFMSTSFARRAFERGNFSPSILLKLFLGGFHWEIFKGREKIIERKT